MTVLRVGAGGLAEANQLLAIGLIYSAMRSALSPTIAGVQDRGCVHGPQNHEGWQGALKMGQAVPAKYHQTCSLQPESYF